MSPKRNHILLAFALLLGGLACTVLSPAGEKTDSGPPPITEDSVQIPQDSEPEFGGPEIEILQTRRASFAITDLKAQSQAGLWGLVSARVLAQETTFGPVPYWGDLCAELVDVEVTNNDSIKAHSITVRINGEPLLEKVEFETYLLPQATYVETVALTEFIGVYCDEPSHPIVNLSVEVIQVDGKTPEESAAVLESRDRSEKRFFDIWLLSNPTDEALPIYWEYRKRDAQGLLLESDENDTCTTQHGDPAEGFSFLPPGQHIIVASELTAEEVEAGITQELTVRPVAGCYTASYFGIAYDPLVVLETFEQHGDMLSVVAANNGQREGWGALYVNIYNAEGVPVYGYSMGAVYPVGIRRIPQGERVSVDLALKASWLRSSEELLVEPSDLTYEFVWLGLSE